MVIYVGVTIRPQLSSGVVAGPLFGCDGTVHAGVNFSMQDTIPVDQVSAHDAVAMSQL